VLAILFGERRFDTIRRIAHGVAEIKLAATPNEIRGNILNR
jgi:hypothetical protein